MVNYTTFDDWKSYMQTVVKENGVGAITGPLLQTVLGELSDTAEWLVSTSGSSADARALAAEGWAVGTQRGVPVTEGSPYYQNNSLYWAEVVNGIAGSLSDVVREARAAAGTAESAAAGANAAAEGATNAASSAMGAAALAEQNAEIASDAAAAATTAKEDAESAASAATAAGDYARGEIDGAKGDFDSLADRFQHVDETAMYFEETGLSADPDLIDEYDRVLRLAYQCITDMQGATATTERATTDATTAAQAARANADYAEQVARQAQTVANQAAAAGDAADAAADEAHDAAVEANQYANQARQAAESATTAAGNATTAAGAAAAAAGAAGEKAGEAETQAAYAKEQGDYAKGEIDGAKGDYDSLADRFQHVDETAMYFEETGLSSDPDIEDEYRRVLRVAYQMLTDMQSATEDTKAKAALAAAAAELCNARSVECAEKTALANTAAAYATEQGNYAKQKADEIDLARGEYQTLSDRLDAMQRQLEAALYFQAVNN
jgi:hypothetical protein